MNYFELAWLILWYIVAIIAVLILTLCTLDKLHRMWETALSHSRIAAIRKVGANIVANCHWFHGPERLAIKALGEHMAETGDWHVDMSHVRDRLIPQIQERERKGLK